MTLRQSVRCLMQQAAGCISAGAWRLCGSPVSLELGILLYHRVTPVIDGVCRPTQNVPPDQFRHQLEGLLKRGYQFWPLSRILRHRSEGLPIPAPVVVVTFDDGYENNFLHARSILEELQIPATIFLNTAYLDGDEPLPFDPWGVVHARSAPADAWRPLRLSQCHQMLEGGLVEFGAHTHTHQDFRGRPDEFAVDLRMNVTILRREFGLKDVPFAFPFGDPGAGYASDDLARAARKAGVSCALSTETAAVDVVSDPFQWGRFNVFEWDTPSTLEAKLSGWYGWAHGIKRKFVTTFATRRSDAQESWTLGVGASSRRTAAR